MDLIEMRRKLQDCEDQRNDQRNGQRGLYAVEFELKLDCTVDAAFTLIMRFFI